MSTSDPVDFVDWLTRRDNERTTGWIVVGQVWKTDDEHLSTFSFLVDSSDLQRRLRAPGSGVNSGDVVNEVVDAYLSSRAYGSVQSPYFDPVRDADQPVSVGSRPFLVESTSHDYRPIEMEFVQAWTLYWNAWWDGDIMKRIDTDGTVFEIARRVRDIRNIRLEAEAHHLKAFLAVAGAGLYRIHDHRRFSCSVASGSNSDVFSDRTGQFELIIGPIDFDTPHESAGRLTGKDVVEPYSSLVGDPRTAPEGFERFIIGRDDGGREQEASADEALNQAPFLTPVYFRSEVLRKYLDAPQLYRLNNGTLTCLYLWSIQFDRRPDDLVQVYLGDLGRLPHIEQRHWRANNVPPPGTGISKERFLRDFEVQWTDPVGDIAFDFKKALQMTREAAVDALGGEIFLPLTAADQHVFDGLRVPVSNGPEESDVQITALAKILVDSTNNDLIRRQIPSGVEPNDRSITLLEKMLQAWNLADTDLIIVPFRELFGVRSTGAAHRRGSNYEKTLRRGGLIDLDNKELVATIMRRLTTALNALTAAIRARQQNQQTGPAA